MAKFEVFDPPMCCSTGICGPSVDPVLPRFAADLDWLRRRGLSVARYNLSQQPAEFVANSTVTAALQEFGNDCLPLILLDGRIVSKGVHPDRSELARLAGLEVASESEPIKAAGGSCCSSPATVTIGDKAGGSSGGCC
ncbi:MAG: arsenite efflux transporter metallochaperone ArsD [Isosphaeraceae bacterium]|nr:arsenite efflux transporter metallochaperone ArsD [Isosphaeraceae bacterium]